MTHQIDVIFPKKTDRVEKKIRENRKNPKSSLKTGMPFKAHYRHTSFSQNLTLAACNFTVIENRSGNISKKLGLTHQMTHHFVGVKLAEMSVLTGVSEKFLNESFVHFSMVFDTPILVCRKQARTLAAGTFSACSLNLSYFTIKTLSL